MKGHHVQCFSYTPLSIGHTLINHDSLTIVFTANIVTVFPWTTMTSLPHFHDLRSFVERLKPYYGNSGCSIVASLEIDVTALLSTMPVSYLRCCDCIETTIVFASTIVITYNGPLERLFYCLISLKKGDF